MSDDFNLKKFLKENKTLEKSNVYLVKLNQKEERFRSSISKMIKEELEEIYDSPEIDDSLNPGNTEDQAKEREGYLDVFGEPEYEELKDYPEGEGSQMVWEKEDKEEDKDETEEDKDETEEEIDTEFSTEEFPEEPEEDEGLFSQAEQEMIDNIENALSTSKTLDNPKLVTQIMNTLKFAQKASLTDEA